VTVGYHEDEHRYGNSSSSRAPIDDFGLMVEALRRDTSLLCVPHRDQCRFLCWFLDAGNNETVRTLSWLASKKRQGTKSREVGREIWQRLQILYDSIVCLTTTSGGFV
jgi:hypothetical protein